MKQFRVKMRTQQRVLLPLFTDFDCTGQAIVTLLYKKISTMSKFFSVKYCYIAVHFSFECQ